MSFAILFPNLSPEIFSLQIGGFTFALRWYALAYIAGILIAWGLMVQAVKAPRLWPGGQVPCTAEQVGDFVTWAIIGIIVGGRLGFVLFYEPAYYLQNPLQIPQIWRGGMAFHGGFLGVVVAAIWFCRKNGIPMGQMADLLAYATPPALALGRTANFINAELWGRPTDVPWGVIFPGQLAQDCPGVVGLCARHPSQLYEAVLEGVVLCLVLIWLVYRKRAFFRQGLALGVFVGGYGLARFIVEFYRQADLQFITPDNPMGYVVQLGPLGVTMGQLLSLPMLIFGLIMLAWSLRKRPADA